MAKKQAKKRPAASRSSKPKARKRTRTVKTKSRKQRAAPKRSARPVKKRASTRRPARKAATVATKRKAPARAATPVAMAPRRAPSLDRARKRLKEVEGNIPTPPSSLDLDRAPSAARSGRREMREAILEHNETGPELTGGDVDADWEDAYAVGDEAPGGDNPTPDQDRVEDIAKALGVEYQDNEELRGSDKITDRDRHRWELDPASSEDYRDRD
jgi:Family of unknown function (DUF6335)